MNKILVILSIIVSLAHDDIWELEEKAPLILESEVVSPDKQSRASLYSLNQVTDEEVMSQQHLKIITPSKSWWLSTIEPGFTTINKIEFIDNYNLLIVQNSFTVDSSSLLNLNTKKRTPIGGGIATYITEGKNKGLFLLVDKKGYLPEGGAYWFDRLIDKNGELIEFLSKEGEYVVCIPTKTILDLMGPKAYPELRKPLPRCIYVDR